MFASMGRFMPPFLLSIYEGGLGLLLPISVGALALVDISHLVHEALEHAHLDDKALMVAESEMHRTAYLRSQRKQGKVIQARYDAIAQKRADAYVRRVEQGDVSFGSTHKPLPQASGLKRVVSPASPPLLLQNGSSQGAPVLDPPTVLLSSPSAQSKQETEAGPVLRPRLFGSRRYRP